MKLTPRDLRLGNIVMVDGQICEVAKLDHGSIGVTRPIMTNFVTLYADAKPIKITEKIFEGLGMNEGAPGYYYIDDIYVSIEGHVYYESEHHIAEIFWAHELQNLLYSLTKKDLLWQAKG